MTVFRLTGTALCLVATLAIAQGGPPPLPPDDGPPPTNEYPPPPPPDGYGDGYGYDYPPPPRPLYVVPREFFVHVRWGVDGKLGYLYPAQAFAFGTSGRLGAQLLRQLGVYLDFGYTAGLGFGGSLTSTGGSLGVSLLGMWHLAPMVEGDFGNFFVAAGPLFGGGSWAQVIQSVDVNGNVAQYAVAASGFLPGVEVRTGFTFGPLMPNGFLGGFTLAVDLKIVSAQVTSVSQVAGPAGVAQAVRTGDRVIGVNPMLVLGYDFH